MHAALRSFAVLLVGSHVGCLPPPLKDCSETGCSDPTTETSGEDPTVPTTSGDGIAVTGDEVDTSSGGTTETTGGSSGTDAEVPAIVSVEVDPDPIEDNGWIAVDVEAVHADGVRMELDDGVVHELALAGRGSFSGQIPAFSGLQNGMYWASLEPWSAGVEGRIVDVPYTINLPEPGSQGPWKTGDGIGVGTVAALGVLPDGHLVELGTLDANGEPRCYLRRRDGDDASWAPEDFVEVLAGAYCNAIDMKIDRVSGALHVLVERKGGNGVQWWLVEIASWGKGAKEIELGAISDNVLALALGDGVMAVCGWKLAQADRDAAVWLVRPGQPRELRVFDYQPKGDGKAHQFDETARDCVFAGETLVMVGEATGPYDGNLNDRDRQFVLEYDTAADSASWTVAGTGPGSDTQSRAFAVDLDDQGRYLLAGYSCGDVCNPAGDIRIYAPGGTLEWQVTIGPLGSALAGPHDIAWSPAGYIVVALAEFDGDMSFRFKVQAFAPDLFQPLWTYIPADMNGLQIALALAIGEFGEVYAGGLAEDEFPAVAYIPG